MMAERDPEHEVDLESDDMEVNDQQGFLGNRKRSHLGSASAEIVPPKKTSHLKESCPSEKESGDGQGTAEEDCCSQPPHPPTPCTEECSMSSDKVPSDSEPMSEAYRKSINVVRPKLEENVLVNNILTKVHKDLGGFLNDREEEVVKACTTNCEKMYSLLRTLKTKTNKDFMFFCEVLESSGYQHFAIELKKAAGINCKPPKDPGPEATHKILKEKKVAYSLHPVIEKLTEPLSTVVNEFRKQVRPLSDDLYDEVVTLYQITIAAKAHVIRLPDVPSHRTDFINHIIKHTTFFDIELIHVVANRLQQPTLTKAVECYEADLEPLMRTSIAELTDRCEVMPINQDSPEGTYRLVLKFPDDSNVKDLYKAKDCLKKILCIPEAKLLAFDFGCILAYFEITCPPDILKDLPKKFTKHPDQLKAMGISGAFLIDHWAWGADSDDVWYINDEVDLDSNKDALVQAQTALEETKSALEEAEMKSEHLRHQLIASENKLKLKEEQLREAKKIDRPGASSVELAEQKDKNKRPEEPHEVWKEEEDVPSLHHALHKLTPSYTTLLQEFDCQVKKESNRDTSGHLCIGTSIKLLTKTTLARRKGVIELPFVSDYSSSFIDKILDNTTAFDIEMITTIANNMKEPTLTEAVEKYEAVLKPLMEASISELTEKVYQVSSTGTYKLVLKSSGNNLVQALYKARGYLERCLNIQEAKLLVLPGGN